MADTDTSKLREAAEADIRSMRAGEAPGGSQAPKKKKSKKKFILLALVLLVGAGGAGTYKFVIAKPDDAAFAEVPEPEPEVEQDELVYIKLDPLFIPFKTNEGQRHKIVVMLSLEVGRKDHADQRVRSLMPRLRESYVRSLTSRPFPGTEDGSIETVYLKNRIRAENNRILGTGVVNDVLVRDIRVLGG
jgi:flagellar basal body-associated protein FliL